MPLDARLRCAGRPNKKGGLYARAMLPRTPRRVLVGAEGGGLAKNSPRRRAQAVRIWKDEADRLGDLAVVGNGGFPWFFAHAAGVVAWVSSHGNGQIVENRSIFVDGRIITSLREARGWGASPRRAAGPGGVPPHRPAIDLNHPRRARQCQVAGEVSRSHAASSASTLIAVQPLIWRANISRGPMGSGAMRSSRARFTVLGTAWRWLCDAGQGAMAIVLAQGGNAAVRLGGGDAHVNAA